MPEIQLRCLCSKVQGKAMNINPGAGMRYICYNNDYQLFSQYLGKANTVLDRYGGTEILQIPLSKLNITKGIEEVACLKLSKHGKYCWYTKCCNTPIGYTLGPHSPFINLAHSFISKRFIMNSTLGEIKGYSHTKFARKAVPSYLKDNTTKIIINSFLNFCAWQAKRIEKRSIFFDENGKPIIQPQYINRYSKTE